MTIFHHPEEITSLARLKEEENQHLQATLLQVHHEELDKIVFQLQDEASREIDCKQCGNCCKSLMINVEEQEADNVADALTITRSTFDERYLEKGINGMMIMNTIPCSFLNNNQCTIYEHRFSGCREFPALHLPDVQKRLFTIFQHYERCPIIFTVVEELKSYFPIQ